MSRTPTKKQLLSRIKRLMKLLDSLIKQRAAMEAERNRDASA